MTFIFISINTNYSLLQRKSCTPRISVFDKLITMVHHCPKELFIWHCAVLSLG